MNFVQDIWTEIRRGRRLISSKLNWGTKQQSNGVVTTWGKKKNINVLLKSLLLVRKVWVNLIFKISFQNRGRDNFFSCHAWREYLSILEIQLNIG